MKNNQKGFSLIEIIVVFAIMAIIGAGALVSFSLVTGQNVKSCAKKIDTYLGQTRMNAMSRHNTVLYLMVEDDGVYAQMYKSQDNSNTMVAEERVKIAKEGTRVRYRPSTAGATLVDLTPGGVRLEISFDRSSGAFKPLPDDTYCTEIIIGDGTNEARIAMVPLTGKYYIE